MQRNKTRGLVKAALSAALISLSAWITVPAAVPYTMQTFAVFLTAAQLGAKKGALAVLIYILLGAAGLPVFSGGRGGLGVLLGETGGYIIGFVPGIFVCGVLLEKLRGKAVTMFLSMLAGLFCVYLAGSLWYTLYLPKSEMLGFGAAILSGVLPFVVPDIIKIALATYVAGRIKGLTI